MRWLCGGALGLALCAGAARADEGEWQRVGDNQGVTLDQQPVDGFPIPKLRAVAEFDAPLYDVLPVLLDASRLTQWMPKCMEARVVRNEGRSRYVYNRTDAPWPVWDRDVVIRGWVIMVEPGTEVHAAFESVEDPNVPPLHGTVRVPLLRGHYALRAIDATHTRVELQLQMLPGGFVPAWLTRMVAQNSAVDTLVALRDQVQATRGVYGPFMEDFLKRREWETPTSPVLDEPLADGATAP